MNLFLTWLPIFPYVFGDFHYIRIPTMPKTAFNVLRHALVFSFCVILSGTVLSSSPVAADAPKASAPKDSLKPGEPAPPFVMRDLVTDEAVFLRDYIGKRLRRQSKQTEQQVVVLSFWATWCEPCKIEIPILTKMAEEFKGKPVRIFLVNTMEYADVTEEMVRDEYTKREYSLQCLIDGSGRVGRQYTARGLPMIVVLGKDGIVRKVNRGFHENFEVDLKKMIADLVDENIE